MNEGNCNSQFPITVADFGVDRTTGGLEKLYVIRPNLVQ